MIATRVLGIALDGTGQHIVLLKPLDAAPGEGMVLPIWIGEQEATSILVALSGEHAPRPLSHDLMKDILDRLECTIEGVAITRVDDGTFYAELKLGGVGEGQVVDARPSDALGLGVRAGCPIEVAQDVFDEASIPAETAESDSSAEAQTQLEEFKRFLNDVEPEDFDS